MVIAWSIAPINRRNLQVIANMQPYLVVTTTAPANAEIDIALNHPYPFAIFIYNFLVHHCAHDFVEFKSTESTHLHESSLMGSWLSFIAARVDGVKIWVHSVRLKFLHLEMLILRLTRGNPAPTAPSRLSKAP